MQSPKLPSPGRRTLFAGAGAAGALAAAAVVLPRAQDAAAPAIQGGPAADAKGGYQLTAHVKQYYAVARS